MSALRGCALVAVVALTAAGAALAGPASAATIKVTTAKDQYGDGKSSCSLREAVQAARDDAAFGGCRAGNGTDTVLLRGGRLYALTRNGPSPGGSNIGLPGDITIRSGGKGLATVDPGAIDDRAFVVGGEGTRIVGLEIQNGNADSGGAIFVSSAGELVIKRSVLRHNRSSGVGGAISSIGFLRVDRSTITGNASYGGGGGIWDNSSGPPTVISRSTLSGNRTKNEFVPGQIIPGTGGAIETGNDLRLVNSTVSGNRADSSGGGVFAYDGATTARNVTITDNIANAAPAYGGIGGGVWGASFALINSIVAGNEDNGGGAGDCYSTSVSLGYSLLGDPANCVFFPSPDNLIGVAPKLKPLADNGGPTKTHALRKGSPARDAGNPAAPGSGGTACEKRDERGVKRPQGPRCDMGAYEL